MALPFILGLAVGAGAVIAFNKSDKLKEKTSKLVDKSKDFADETLAIPMYGFTRSFNVSVAAAICFYELKQKLIKSDIDYKLSEEKLWKMKVRWAVNSIASGPQILEKYFREQTTSS